MIDLDSMNHCGGKLLSQHEGDDSRPCAYIEDQPRPDMPHPQPLNRVCAEHCAVGTHLHSCFALLELEAFHPEDGHKLFFWRVSEVESTPDLIDEIRFFPGKELHLLSERPTIPIRKGLRRRSRCAADMSVGRALPVDRRLQVK